MASSYTMMLSLHPRRLTNARLWKELHQCVQRAGHKQRNGPCHGPLPSVALASHHVAAAAPANVFLNVWSAVGCAPAHTLKHDCLFSGSVVDAAAAAAVIIAEQSSE